MGWVEGCRKRPLPENKTAPKRSTAHKTFILHSAVGSSSPWGYFARASTVTESHGWTGLDGKSEEFLEDDLRADAQWDANPWAWAWETADNGHPDTFEWTAAQIEELARILAWFHIHHGLPLRLCRTWDDDGIGYHRQFKEWNHSGHTCPGTVRIKQIPAIIARAIEIVEENSMDKADVKAAVLEALATKVIVNAGSNPVTKFSVNSALQNIEADGDLDKARLKALTASVAALTAALKLLSSGQALTVKQITAAAEAGAAAALAGGVDVNVTVGGTEAP